MNFQKLKLNAIADKTARLLEANTREGKKTVQIIFNVSLVFGSSKYGINEWVIFTKDH